jgi:arabinofuranosyltransferase
MARSAGSTLDAAIFAWGREKLAWLRQPGRLLSLALSLAPLAMVCLAALANAHIFREAQIDDSYITFRYADNLGRGLGPVYNAGEHVEGSSSFLFFVLLAPIIRMGCDPLAVARVISMAAFVATVAVAYGTVLVTASQWPRLLAMGAAVLVASSSSLAYYANPGLETDVYALLVMLAFALLVRPGAGHGWIVAAGMAAACRPEGPLFFPALLALATLRCALREGPKGAVAHASRAIGVFLLVFGPVLAFRLAYYHAWVPNTVVAKAGATARLHGLDLRAVVTTLAGGEGASEVRETFRRFSFGWVFVLAGLASRRTRFAVAAALCVAFGCAALTIWSDGDWMGRGRLLTPVIGPLAVAIALGTGAAVDAVASRWRRRSVWELAAACSFAVLASGMFSDRHFETHSQRTIADLRWLGSRLRANSRDDDLLATDIGGRVPYYSRMRTLETFGLCDPYIARHGKPWARMGKTDFDYVVARAPTFYLFNFATGARDLFREPAFRDHQSEYLAVLTPGYLAGAGKLLLVRKDRPALDQLAQDLGASLTDARVELHRLNLL